MSHDIYSKQRFKNRKYLLQQWPTDFQILNLNCFLSRIPSANWVSCWSASAWKLRVASYSQQFAPWKLQLMTHIDQLFAAIIWGKHTVGCVWFAKKEHSGKQKQTHEQAKKQTARKWDKQKSKETKKQKREGQSSEVVTYRSRTTKQQRSSYAGRKAKRQKNRKAKKQNSGKQQSKKEEPRETSKHKLPNNKKTKKQQKRNEKLQTTGVVRCSCTIHAPCRHRAQEDMAVDPKWIARHTLQSDEVSLVHVSVSEHLMGKTDFRNHGVWGYPSFIDKPSQETSLLPQFLMLRGVQCT